MDTTCTNVACSVLCIHIYVSNIYYLLTCKSFFQGQEQTFASCEKLLREKLAFDFDTRFALFLPPSSHFHRYFIVKGCKFMSSNRQLYQYPRALPKFDKASVKCIWNISEVMCFVCRHIIPMTGASTGRRTTGAAGKV